MSTWNYRVLAQEDGDDMFFDVHEVYYDDEGKPNVYTANPASPGSETIAGISLSLTLMKKCLKKPILWAGERFPEKYRAKENDK